MSGEPPPRRSIGRGRARRLSTSQPGTQTEEGAAASAAAIQEPGRGVLPPEVAPALTIATPADEAASETGRGRIRGVPEKKPTEAEKGSPATSISEEGNGNGNGSPKKDLEKKLGGLGIDQFAARPGFGSAGRQINLETNHFLLKYPDKLVIYQYIIDLKHARYVLNREDNRMAFWALAKSNPFFQDLTCLCYDGVRTFFSLNPLKMPNGGQKLAAEVNVRLLRENRPVTVTALVEFVSEVHIDMRQVRVSALHGDQYVTPLQFLDLVCRQARSVYMYGSGSPVPSVDADAWYPFGASTYMVPGFHGPQPPLNLGGGCDLWHGLFSSAHVGQGYRPLLNIDVANGSFYHNNKLPVVQLLVEVLNDAMKANMYHISQLTSTSELKKHEMEIFRKAITGLRVGITHRPEVIREYRVHGIRNKATDTKFNTEENGEISVATYFNNRYGALKYPKLPVLHCGSKKIPTYFPIEHCYVAHPQRRAKQLSDMQLSAMIKGTAIPAPDRKQKILSIMREANLDNDPWLRSHGIEISKDMTKLVGRVLTTAKVEYNAAGSRSRNPVVEPRNGEWSMDGQKVFQAAAPLTSYGLLVERAMNQNMLKSIFPEFRLRGEEMGVQIAPTPKSILVYEEGNIEQQVTAIAKDLEVNSNGLKFIFIVTPKKSTAIYAEVKRVSEIMTGVMSQCLLFKTAQTILKRDLKSRQTLQNLVLKINAKMGGINNQLVPEGLWKSLTDEKSCTLFVGADVSHPPPFDRISPSIAALVSNVDLAATRYSASIRVQKRRRDPIMDLYQPIRERLLAFHKEAKAKPTRLVFYRDGVAESQFREVFIRELKNIRDACASLDPDYRPKVTFIIAAKRHHTRFFCLSRADESGRSRNVPPGTIVDTDITSPHLFDFYLCSHIGIQGTSRPVRYTVLYDENKFPADEVQMMTYALSNVYCRCTRSVSIPTPVYYAHWACLRAKHHLANKVASFGSDMTESSGTSIAEEELVSGVL